jgi:hypothetical protein
MADDSKHLILSQLRMIEDQLRALHAEMRDGFTDLKRSLERLEAAVSCDGPGTTGYPGGHRQ